MAGSWPKHFLPYPGLYIMDPEGGAPALLRALGWVPLLGPLPCHSTSGRHLEISVLCPLKPTALAGVFVLGAARTGLCSWSSLLRLFTWRAAMRNRACLPLPPLDLKPSRGRTDRILLYVGHTHLTTPPDSLPS